MQCFKEVLSCPNAICWITYFLFIALNDQLCPRANLHKSINLSLTSPSDPWIYRLAFSFNVMPLAPFCLLIGLLVTVVFTLNKHLISYSTSFFLVALLLTLGKFWLQMNRLVPQTSPFFFPYTPPARLFSQPALLWTLSRIG